MSLFSIETAPVPLDAETYVMHQMRNKHGGSHALHFGVTPTTMHMGTNQKAQQSCGSGTDRE